MNEAAVLPEKSALALRHLGTFDASADIGEDDLVFDAPGVEAVTSCCAGIVLPTGDAARAATLLAAGANCVFLGEAALLDSGAVEQLVARHGGARIGIFAPLRRQSVSWAFETVSNADFKVVAPSLCDPAWEVLKADGSATGTLALWWLAAMRDLGASRFLVQTEISDDTDLNLCAGLVEAFGEAVWLAPRDEAAPCLADWVAFGQCRRIALPTALFARRAELLPDAFAPSVVLEAA